MKKKLGLLLAAMLTLSVAPAIAIATGPAAGAAEIDPVLADQLAAAKPTDHLLVFVHGEDIDASAAAVKDAGLVPVAEFARIGVTVAAGTPAQLTSLTGAPGVTYLEADQTLSYDLSTSVKAVRAEQARDELRDGSDNAIDGRGITIAINDSGIDGTHPMFDQGGTSKVVRNLKLNPICRADVLDALACDGASIGDANDDLWIDGFPDTDTTAAGGHGTHVAGIAAGVDVTTADGRAMHGTAPGAKLVGLSHGAGLTLYGTAASMNWVLEHHDAPCGAGADPVACPPVRIISSSISAPSGSYDPESVVAKLQDALVADNVVVVWSAGNFGTDATGTEADHTQVATVYSFKQSPTPGVITAANYDDGNTGTREGGIAPSSSKGKIGEVGTYPDLAAPGSLITSACRAYLAVCTTGLDTADPNYNTISGTSMSAPHVAGVVAQLLQANPALTPAQVEDILEDSAHKFGTGYEADLAGRNADDETSFDKGHGLLDATAAVAAALSVPDPGIANPCVGDHPVVADPAGDAKSVVVDTPLPSEPNLDVREGRVRWDEATQTLIFTAKMTDITAEPPRGSIGWVFDYEFTYAGQSWDIFVRQSPVNNIYRLSQFEATGRAVRIDRLSGSLDPATDLLTVRLSNADLARSSVPIPAFGSGAALGGFTITSRRDTGLVIPNADEAGAICGYVIP